MKRQNLYAVQIVNSEMNSMVRNSTNHIASDSEMCEVLKSKIRLHTSSTDYKIKPYQPRYLGKVEHTRKYQGTNRVTSNLSSLTIGGSTDSILSLTRSRMGSANAVSDQQHDGTRFESE